MLGYKNIGNTKNIKLLLLQYETEIINFYNRLTINNIESLTECEIDEYKIKMFRKETTKIKFEKIY